MKDKRHRQTIPWSLTVDQAHVYNYLFGAVATHLPQALPTLYSSLPPIGVPSFAGYLPTALPSPAGSPVAIFPPHNNNFSSSTGTGLATYPACPTNWNLPVSLAVGAPTLGTHNSMTSAKFQYPRGTQVPMTSKKFEYAIGAQVPMMSTKCEYQASGQISMTSSNADCPKLVRELFRPFETAAEVKRP